MSTVNYKCPCCGGPLAYSGESDKLECSACGNSYELADMEALDLEEEGSQLEFELKAESFGEGDAVTAYTCENCGAELICDETTTATECPYCGSPTILPDHIKGGVKPEKVVPFVITKEQATEAFEGYFKGKKLMPNIFLNTRNRISEMRKLFVPYWLFNCDAYADIVYNAEKKHVERHGDYEVTRVDHYAVRRKGTLGFDDIPVDGSQKMDDKITESLEPYDCSKAVPFQSAVLSGAMADHADVAAEDCQNRVEERVETSTENAMRSTVRGYDNVTVRKKFIRTENGSVTPVLMPVWLITTEKEEPEGKKTYTYAINGQTGKLTCDVPYAKGKAFAWFGGIFGGVTAVAMALLAILEKMQSGPIIIAVIVALLAGLIAVSIMKGQLKTAHNVSGAANYERDDSLELEIKHDRFLYQTTTRRKIQTNQSK